MAKKLTGMEIFKLLPKTNCGECGVPTCMAFAMKLAQKNVEFSVCHFACEAAGGVIGLASEPPIRLVRFGSGSRTVTMGNELVMFRHEKTFVHQTALAVQLDSTLPDSGLQTASSLLDKHTIERAGEKLSVDALLVNDAGDGVDRFCAAVRTVAASFGGPLILKSASAERLVKAAEMVPDRFPLLHALTGANADVIGEYAHAKKLPVAIAGNDLSDALAAKDHRDIVLDLSASSMFDTLRNNTIVRKAALNASIRQVGYPIMNFVTGRTSPAALVADASTALCKYASLLVIDRFEPETLLPLLMLRQNVYTDPQKPIQVEPKVYPVGEPNAASPLLVTTNFSLTYFIVSGEVESSGVPAHLAVVDAEGLSVLTAWAAGKFSAEKIAAFINAQEIGRSLTKKKVVLPGYVSCLSGELEEKMPGWEVLVGPQEASDIGPFMKRFV
jgi:acetyl-CoA decarbonylase/synthase complex subunit gamma